MTKAFFLLVLLPSPFSLFPFPFSLLSAQPTSRIVTNVEALVSTPVFFHGRQIAIRQPLAGSVDLTRLDNTSKPIFVFLKEPPGAVRDAELRGEFWDLGRLQPDDARFSALNFEKVLEAASSGQWPPRDRVFVILNATLVEAPLPPSPTVRAIVLAPDRYVEREVRISGRFRGRNLHGDLPQPLNKDRWDFVLQSADASIWISGMRPKGKDFDLDPGARVDTGKWLEVTGVVQKKGAQLWIEASAMRPTTAPSDVPVEVVVPVRPVEPPPTVVFTAPVQDDVDVERGASVRIQFSRDLSGASIANRVRVTYTSAEAGAQPPPPPPFTAAYQEGTRSIEIKFAQPLERFTAVKVELLEGIRAFDGQPLAPFTLTFTTGG
jgi:Big-like domain-containing protein